MRMLRFVSTALILCLISGVMPIIQISNALQVLSVEEVKQQTLIPGGGSTNIRSVSGVETRYGLVAILVESGIWENSESYEGLDGTLSAVDTRLYEKIERYAEDIQAGVPWTKTLVVTVEADDSTVEIQEMLERLYFEGDPNDSDLTRLSGVVIIGDVPLPIVNKNGYRFMSLLPYTDFEDAAYIVDEDTNDFTKNTAAINLQADVWHGLIVPPEGGEEGNQMLAEFFDKNHSYHEEESEYYDFDKKVFVGDLVTEGNTVNSVSFASYERFIKYWEEIAYYRYTNTMVEDIYTDMQEEIEEGDLIDNDSDGDYDEEANNARDDDGDGLVDEDLGDGFYGIDNDQDGAIDEDSSQDNNNDDGWSFYDDKWDDVPFYEDDNIDEDPPGDANGDGCPGICGEDDNGNSIDHDEDNIPSGIEMMMGYKWNDSRNPWFDFPSWISDAYFGESGLSDSKNENGVSEAGKFLRKQLVDENYPELFSIFGLSYSNSGCYDGSTYHGEWDDDEDGYCDEDGGSEDIDEDTGCIYNDADCDGEVDEDPMGMKPDPIFDDLPDVQAKKLVEGLMSRYMKIFQEPIGVWNRVVDATGRYETRKQNDDGSITNEYDSAVSLIAKKDEFVLQYLRNMNDHFESEVNDMVDELAEEIPLIGLLQITGTITFEAEDDESDPVTEEICDPEAGVSECPQFFNHTTSDISTENIFASVFRPNVNQYYFNGIPIGEVDSVDDCSLVSGTVEEGGRFVQMTSLFSMDTANVDDSEIDEYKGCLISNVVGYLEDETPEEVCFNAIATEPQERANGSKKYTEEDTDGDGISEEQENFRRQEISYPACFEFRSRDTYQIYNKVSSRFAELLEKEKAKSESEYDSWEEMIVGIKDDVEEEYEVRPGSATLRQGFDEIPIWEDGDGRKYTIKHLVQDLGYDDQGDDAIDLILTFNSGAEVDNPQYGVKMDDVEEIDVDFQKRYVNEARNDFTDDLDDAAMISSVYKHTEPKNGTLNEQYADGSTPNMPIDATRRISFMDADEQEQVLNYINFFDAENAEDIQSQIDELAETMDGVYGGASYVDDIEDFYSELNEEALSDFLAWRQMNIDEKHEYIFTHYLGAEEAVTAKARNGYEIVSLIAEGTPTDIYFAFNGAAPTDEGDLEWLYKSQEAIDAALAESTETDDSQYGDYGYLTEEELEYTIPIPLDEWMDEILKFIEDMQNTLSGFDTFSGDEYCASEELQALGGTANNADEDESGIPDVADATASLKITSESNDVLNAYGDGSYTVSVSARKSDNSVNTEDSYTEVEVVIVSGEDSVQLVGDTDIKLTSGVATFVLQSNEPGDFTVKVSPANRDDLSDSNSLSGEVSSKYIRLTTYSFEDYVDSGSTEEIGENIEVYNADGEKVADLDTSTGDLELSDTDDVEVKILEASGESPTRIAIQSSEGEIYAVFFLIPDGSDAVEIEVENSGASYESDENGDFVLSYDGVQMGAVNSSGQISMDDGYYLEFENLAAINVFDPILILDEYANTLFKISIELESEEIQVLESEGYSDYLSLLGGYLVKKDFKKGARGKTVEENIVQNIAKANIAQAAEIEDSDADGLDDLEEWTIGTDVSDEDSDDDGYKDGAEIYSGYDPLEGSNALLFSDLFSDDEAFHDVAVLYLRGVIQGYTDGSFRPDDNLTREEFLQVDLGGICVRCANFSNEYKEELLTLYNEEPFPDTDINDELLYCVAEGKTREIVSGYEGGDYDGYFLPKNNIIRAEATKVLLETAGIEAQELEEGDAWYMGYAKAALENGIFPDGTTSVTTAWLEDYITRAEFAQMAVNLIEAQDCREKDSDEEGLSDTEEDYIYGTNKDNADSDYGGVNDFDEVVRGTDPNDPDDDFGEESDDGADDDSGSDGGEESEAFVSDLSGVDLESGFYGTGSLNYETISSSTSTSSEVKVYTDLVPADGESYLYVQAEIRDQDGNVYLDDNSSIIEFTLSTEEYGVLESDKVRVTEGKADTIFNVTTVAGEVEVEASITDGSIPNGTGSVRVYPGTAVKVVVSGESTVLPAGGETVSDMRVTLYDTYNNVADYEFATVTIEAEGTIELLDLYDEDEETEGYQITTSAGYIDFRIQSASEEETSYVKASLLEVEDSGDSFAVENIDGMAISVESSEAYMTVGSSGTQTINVSIKDANGDAVTGFNGDVSFSLSDDAYGTLSAETGTLVSGATSVDLTAGTLAGVGSVIVSSSGLSSGSTSVEFKPADPYELLLKKEDGGTILQANEASLFNVEVYDEYGNLVTNDSSTVVDIRKTDATTEYAKLSSSQITVSQGVGEFRATAKSVSGKLNLVASSTGLISGSFGGDIVYAMNSSDFKNIEPQNLFTSMLGGPFGDVTESGYLGGYMTFNGRTQAMTTLIEEPTPKEKIASIDSNGKIDLADSSLIGQSISSAGEGLPTRIIWRNFPDDIMQAEIFYITKEGFTAELLTDSYELTLEEKNGAVILREDSAAVVKVRKDGQIVILDPNYNLSISASGENLSFIVSRTTEQVMTVSFDSGWSKDVRLLGTDFDIENYASLSPGIYVKPSQSSKSNFISMPSGNSTANSMGLALINPEEDLGKEMQPSLGYASLEKAGEVGTIGWEQENKHILLMSAGNMAGDANLFYTSEIGVLLGDPTIRLTTENETNEAGFTQDIGKMLYASEEEILTMLDIDYNGDEMNDVFVVYENGRIDVLQNSKSPNRLNNRGTILMVENEINSVDKGDFNGDGLDDLLVVTKTSCLADEMCLYVYTNIGGGFVAQNLTFTDVSSKPKQVEAEDMNGDGYTEIIIFDENLNLYLVWNNEGSLDTVEKVDSFGLEADGTTNLYADLAVHYDGMADGSVTLSLPADEFLDQGTVDDFLDSDDYLIDSSGLQATEENYFEYADDIDDILSITKVLTDNDGGTIDMEDQLTYSIEINNVSGSSLSGIYVADSVPGSFDFDEEIYCDNCDEAEIVETGDHSKPWAYGPLDLSNGESATISYLVTVADLPDMNIMVGNDIYSDYTDDDYPDFAVSPEGNTGGMLIVYYSDGYDSTDGYKKIDYVEKTYEAQDASETELESEFVSLDDTDGDGTPDAFEDIDQDKGIPLTDGNRNLLETSMGATDEDGDGYINPATEFFKDSTDADGDGLNDSIDNWAITAAGVAAYMLDPDAGLADLEDGLAELDGYVQEGAEFIEDVIATFFCNGGCIAMPSNIAFLSPGNFHDPFTGTVIEPAFRGIPIFGILPAPAPPVVCFFIQCYASNIFRFYIDITSTLGIAIAICVFPYGETGQCFAFTLPILDMLGVCDAINGAITDALSGASKVELKADTKIFKASASASVGGGESGVSSTVFDGYTPPIVVNTNIQVPGFPSVFTEWWKKQKFEFFQMLDLPDVTFIFPDPATFGNAIKPIEKNRDVELGKVETTYMGLEKFLSTANAWPTIDIKTETVYIKYPWLIPEEIEKVKQDWQEWKEDLEKEWERFVEELGPEIDQNLFAELETTYKQLISQMENNLSILEEYTHIPDQILELRNIQAEYAKIIVCYLDAILSFTGGYLATNAQRIEMWVKWVTELKNIVSGWKALIDLSIEFNESCDKCTNQRFGVFQILVNLFVFIPDLPVIDMPKLPDIIIDVSNIQAGVDVLWPDIKFIPESLNIPEIPRISLPHLAIEVDANFDFGIELPILPEFSLEYELPELPSLSLPDLPDLPPPPELPKIDATFEAGLDIVSTILKIVCLIRSNFFPVGEMDLKTKIEEMTERSSSILLPIDLSATVEFPKISFDMLKRIEIKTYLNLKLDFTAIYDVVNILSEKSNKFITDIVQEVNKIGADASSGLQDALDEVGEIDVDIEAEADVEVQAETDDEQAYDPARAVAYSYRNNSSILDQAAALKSVFKDLQKGLDDWKKQVPDSVDIVATERILAWDDPLLNRYDEIIKTQKGLDSNFLAAIEGTPLVNVARMRDALIASVQNIESGSQKLKNMNGENFLRYLAMENESGMTNFALASNDNDEISSTDGFDLNKLVEEPEDLTVELSEESDVSTQLPQAENSGIYIYDESLGLSGQLIKYNAESEENVNILMMDVDNDDDDDILYSLGGDIYLKENHTESASLKYVSDGPDEYSLSDLIPVAGNVNNFEEGDNSYQEASFSFGGSEEPLGYEVIMYDSLDAQESEPDENVKRLLLLSAIENESSEIAEDVATVVSTLRQSRLTVTASSGTVTLKNAAERTEIDENGEIETEEAVIFQTLEDSKIEVIVGGETVSFEALAGYNIEFPQSGERTIRVETGKVLWINEAEIIEEQDLTDGMEIYADELISLESAGGDVDLKTSEGTEITLDKEEDFAMDALENPTNPTVQVELENGAYYSQVRGLYAEGYSTVSDGILLNPQICGDDSEPYPVISDSSVDVAIFSTTEVSAAGSFDSDSEVTDAYWDLDASIDEDGNGVTNDDEDLSGLTVEIGPYDEIGEKQATVWISDTAGNQSSANVTVNIYVPDIEIASASSSEISGTTEIESPNMPFHLIRERDGAYTEIGEEYTTDEYGDFAISGFTESDLLSLSDIEGDQIAEFNPETKQLLIYDDDYEALALESSEDWPSRLVVAEIATGEIKESFIIVADADYGVDWIEQDLEDLDLSAQKNVTVHVLEDESNYLVTEDGLEAIDEFGVKEAIIWENGNVTFYDSRFELKKRDADSLDEYLILELYDSGVLEVEFFIGAQEEVEVTDTVDLGLPESEPLFETAVEEEETEQYFADISEDDPLFEDIAELYERGIIEGYEENGERYFEPNASITRAEFAKIILLILCIDPSDEAYILPNVFNDITSISDWFYSYTKESFIREIITGYLGEVDANGLAPFKPNNTITVAEAAKIMLEAMDGESIIDLPDDLSGEPWYEPYIEIAQDFSEYMIEESAGEENYILTADEAADPAHVVTRYEFVKMSVRALKAYNCYNADTDEDGITDFEEENTYLTDPLNEDTDGGGILDGEEIGRDSDPLDQEDDFPESPVLDLESGVYAIEEECNSCPCESNVDFASDFVTGDKVFAIIKNDAGEIFEMSNEVEITE